ncbi:MAG: NHL repeat-containing protein [Acidobacteriota bacterium]|nr:NHL repeat-containing protein [Acidobacteriota bacterium]
MTQAARTAGDSNDAMTWEVLLGAPGARPIHSLAQGPDGRWYLTDELNHRLMILEGDGTRRLVGGPGYDGGQFLHPRGIAVFAHPESGETRVYVCDAGNHRIQVLSAEGQPLGAFGGFGAGAGLFNAPTAIAVATPDFGDGQGEGEAGPDPLLVVADQRNNRLQVFEPDGQHVAVIGATDPRPGRPLSRTGWPHFRLGTHPWLHEPTHLSWEDEELIVVSSSGDVVRLDLAVALLPDFETWRRDADRRATPHDNLLVFSNRRLFGVADGTAARVSPARTGAGGRTLPAAVERLLCRL